MDAEKIASDIKDKLSGMSFPMKKDELVRKAREWGVSQDTIDTLSRLPEQTYESAKDIANKLPITEVKRAIDKYF